MNNIKMTIDEILNDIGIPHKYLGRQYVTQCLLILFNSSSRLSNTAVYEQVANMYNTTVDGVERNVRWCFTQLNYSNPVVSSLFKVSPRTGKVSVKEGLYSLLSELRFRHLNK